MLRDDKHDAKGDGIVQIDMPRIHSHVDLADIKADGSLLFDAKDLASMDRNAKQKVGIIKVEDAEYVLYKKKLLGEGSYGAVCLAQNIANKSDWVAIKVALQPEGIAGEVEQLRATKMLRAAVDRNCLIMELMPGQVLHTIPFFQKADRSWKLRSMPTVRWLQIGVSVLEAIEKVHAAGLLHRDIKTNNIMYDPVTNKASAVDFGFAIPLNVKKEIYDNPDDIYRGTPGFAAPEMESQGISSELTDVFALGKTLACLYDLAEKVEVSLWDKLNGIEDDICLVKKDNNQYKYNERIPNPELRAAVYDLLQKMIDPDPEKRCSLGDAKKILKIMICEHLFLPAKINNIGILDVDEYRNLKQEERSNMMQALSHFDEVCFVDTVRNRNAREYMEVFAELQKNAIQVGNKLFIGNDKKNIIAGIPQQIEKKDPDAVNNYFFVSKDPNDFSDLQKNKINVMAVTQNKSTVDYKKELADFLRNTPLDVRHLELVRTNLNNEINRLRERYQYGNEYANKRIAAIRASLVNISKGNFSYAELKQELGQLQNKMTATSGLAEIVRRLLGYEMSSTGKENIAKLNEQVNRQAAPEAEFKRFNTNH